jgi:8-oxo-dGTP diphosphatase
MAFVRLAGGILWREGSAGPRLAVIHRPRQADWSLPKGRMDERESWEQAALREVEEETGCEARITSFAGAASYVQRRTPRLVLYWHMALIREEPFAASKEVDELVWLAPADALARLDHETERRVLQRSRPPGAQRPAPKATGALTAELAAARAEILRRVLSLPAKGNAAGLGPALDLLDRAEEAWAGGAAKEASAMTAEARRMGLLALSEPELSLRARALREEARGLGRSRRRAIRRLLSPAGEVSPEAVHLAAGLRDQALAERVRPARPIAAIFAAAVAALALVLCLRSSSERGHGLLAALCGTLAGAAIAALYYSRSFAKERQ